MAKPYGATNEYHREYQRRRYAKRKAWAIEYLGGQCSRCGSTEELEFDHIDTKDKEFDITIALSKYAWARIEAELGKCQLLCKPHHIAKTIDERSGIPQPEMKAMWAARRERNDELKSQRVADRDAAREERRQQAVRANRELPLTRRDRTLMDEREIRELERKQAKFDDRLRKMREREDARRQRRLAQRAEDAESGD